jgi:hypothetical protein
MGRADGPGWVVFRWVVTGLNRELRVGERFTQRAFDRFGFVRVAPERPKRTGKAIEGRRDGRRPPFDRGRDGAISEVGEDEDAEAVEPRERGEIHARDVSECQRLDREFREWIEIGTSNPLQLELHQVPELATRGAERLDPRRRGAGGGSAPSDSQA